jgi:hypothetical protein
MKRALLALMVGGVLLTAGTAGYAGAHQGQKSYAPWLKASIDGAELTRASNLTTVTPYLVEGCGYDGSLGGVTVVVHSPQAISFAGGLPAGDLGCISLSNFSTQGPGHYQIDAYQTIHGKSRIVASTYFDL